MTNKMVQLENRSNCRWPLVALYTPYKCSQRDGIVYWAVSRELGDWGPLMLGGRLEDPSQSPSSPDWEGIYTGEDWGTGGL